MLAHLIGKINSLLPFLSAANVVHINCSQVYMRMRKIDTPGTPDGDFEVSICSKTHVAN